MLQRYSSCFRPEANFICSHSPVLRPLQHHSPFLKQGLWFPEGTRRIRWPGKLRSKAVKSPLLILDNTVYRNLFKSHGLAVTVTVGLYILHLSLFWFLDWYKNFHLAAYVKPWVLVLQAHKHSFYQISGQQLFDSSSKAASKFALSPMYEPSWMWQRFGWLFQLCFNKDSSII